MRNRHHKSKSIISALPLADDIQNDICKIKKYKIPKGCSKGISCSSSGRKFTLANRL